MTAGSHANEFRLTRVYDAPVRAVWDAWTIPAQVEQWWGPRGFTLTTHARDLRPGGIWRFTMHGPDGVDYPNVTRYLVVEPPKRLVYDHGGSDDAPAMFRVEVRFAEAGGRTTMELRFTLPTPEAAAEMARRVRHFGGNATWAAQPGAAIEPERNRRSTPLHPIRQAAGRGYGRCMHVYTRGCS